MIPSLFRSDSEREIDHIHREAKKLELQAAYEMQMQEQRAKKEREKQLEFAEDVVFLESLKHYSPWGRGGGGAPFRGGSEDGAGAPVHHLLPVASGVVCPGPEFLEILLEIC